MMMKHIEAAVHTRGESEYVDDMPRPANMLHAAVFGSPVAHGEILALHLEKARALEGVAAVLTAQDIPGENQIGPIIQDETLLAEDEVHFIDQPVALVVAKSPEIARKAVRLISLDVAELPVITNPKEAFQQGDIIGAPRTFALGEVDKAWEKCEVIAEGTCDIGGQEHVYLETQRARSMPLEGRAMRIYSSTQSPYAAQKTAARILGIPQHLVEVDVKRLGGGFGGKEDQATLWAVLAALGARHTKMPVEIVLNRAEDIKMTGKRHPYLSDFKIGANRDGQILAYDVKHYQNSGSAADLSTAILERSLFHSTNSYFIPNVRIFGACCRTNLPPNTAFRGFGGPQAMFVIESAITSLAEKSGMPREEIQRKNLIAEGDLFPYGQKVQHNIIREAWQTAEAKYAQSPPGRGRGGSFENIRQRIDNFNATHFETKKGFAVMPVMFGISFTATFLNQASALVHVYTDGSVSVSTGGVEMGQGLSTNIVSIAAKTLGIRPERVKFETTNTKRIANMSASAASATTLLNGNAAMMACNHIFDRLKKIATKELAAENATKITIVDEKVLHDGQPTALDWQSLVQTAYLNRIALSAHAFYATPNVHFDKLKEKGHPFAYHVCGIAIVEVTLDCLRGTYDIDSVKIVHDLGRPLNKIVDRGQVEGGLAQGLGWMTLEDLRYGENGQLLSGALATYKVPDVYFMPDDIDITWLHHTDDSYGPYGSKAVGEPPLMYGLGVFFALRHAMRAFRPDADFAFTSPLTPERVLMGLYAGEVRDILARNASKPKKKDRVKTLTIK
ncbi:MAG: xanthine dehydrogenase molybdopterin binding subunit [bacterium]